MFQSAQVWYHVCPNRGRGCYNTRLKEDGGCTIWYNEKEVRIKAYATLDILKLKDDAIALRDLQEQRDESFWLNLKLLPY